METISKKIILPKVGNIRITFYRDRRSSTKDRITFSLPFDVDLPDKTGKGEIIYSPVFRSCRIMWSEPLDDEKTSSDIESFIKEFLFGTLLSLTEPILPEEMEHIFENLMELIKSSVQYKINEDGSCAIFISLFLGKSSKLLKILIRKKDTGDFFITDEGEILRSFRPHEIGQREKVVLTAKKIGIDIRDEELFLDSSPDELINNLYKFIQMITGVYLFYLV